MGNKKRSSYEKVLKIVRKKGKKKGDRTGTGTISLFNEQMTISYDLSKGFPLITTKRVPMRLIVSELLWFLRGDDNLRELVKQDNHIWSDWPFKQYRIATGQSVPTPNTPEWETLIAGFEAEIIANEEFASMYGGVGPIYGVQWVSWPAPNGQTINQIENVVNTIKSTPDSRRLVVSAWNPADLSEMSLEPCHALFQFNVTDGKLSCKLYQRSADMFLGVPFNIASYALLTHMVAQQCDLEVGEFVWVGGDTHIYLNHLEQVDEQLSREVRPLPTISFNRKPDSIFDYTDEDIVISDYNPHPTIKGDIAV